MSSPILERLERLLLDTPPFELLPETDRQRLLGDLTTKIYDAGEVILEQGDDLHRALYLVESGLVRLVDRETGRTINLCGPGSTFGGYGLMQGGPRPYEARTTQRTTCALLDAGVFEALAEAYEPFQAFFREEIQRYVRTLDAELDASGAYLLFETHLADVVSKTLVTVTPETTARETARALSDASAEAAVVLRNGEPVGVVTEGDLVEHVLAGDMDPDGAVMTLVERPPIALRSDENLFDVVRTMMHHRIRRVVVMRDGAEDSRGEERAGRVLGLLSNEDVSHFRGLDPVSTTERMERAGTVSEIAALRAELHRRLLRLYNQGVHGENLLDLIAEVDDQLTERVLLVVEGTLRNELTEEDPTTLYDGDWAWLDFGARGRREATLRTWQQNGLVYTDPPKDETNRADAYFALLAERATEALDTCGLLRPEQGVCAHEPAFRRPLSVWQDAYRQWASTEAAERTERAALCFDLRVTSGEHDLGAALRDTIAEFLPSDRLPRVLARPGVTAPPPLSSFHRFDLQTSPTGEDGVDLNRRALTPIIQMARALALDTEFLRETGTFARLRHVANSDHPAADAARMMAGIFGTLVDLHLRYQMEEAEAGARPSDWVAPDRLHKSQQNLLKETFQTLQSTQKRVKKVYGL